MKSIKAFKNPIYVVRPVLPDIHKVNKKLKEVWDSQWLTNGGTQHQALEEKIKHYLNVPNVSLFCNGTLALDIAIKALDLKGEVITTAFTFPATVHMLHLNNLTPVFCDIEEQTYNIDPKKIESLITKKTSAIMPVHVFGNPCDVEAIDKIAKKYKLKVIYDAAHAFGVKVKNKSIGIFGDISMFSFHATKVFHTIEGGALTYNNKKYKEVIDYLKNFGIKNEEEVVMPGTNAKMNEVSASIGLLVLDCLKEERKKRKILSDLYRKKLEQIEGIKTISDINGVNHNYYAMPILIDEKKFGIARDDLYNKLKEFNIFGRRYFYPLCSQFDIYSSLPTAKKVPISEKITNGILCMPLYGDLKIEEIEKICDIVKFIKNAKK